MSCETADRIAEVAFGGGVPVRHLVQAVTVAVLARQSPDRTATVRTGSASLAVTPRPDDTVTGIARRLADAERVQGPITISTPGTGRGLPGQVAVRVLEGPADRLALVTGLSERQIARVVTALQSLRPAGGEPPRVRELSLCCPADARELSGWGRQLASVPAISLDELVARWARQRPNRPIAMTPERTLGYAEADRRATRLASALTGAGVQHGEPVLVCTGDGLETVTAHVAVLRAGAVCVPVPCGALRAAARLTRARVALCDRPPTGAQLTPGLRALNVTDPLDGGTAPVDRSLPRSGFTDCAYAVVRTGQDGRLYADLIDHHAWVSATTGRLGRAGVPAERVLVDGPLCTPVALAGMWWALQSGGTVCLAGGGRIQPDVTDVLLTPVDYVRLLPVLNTARPPRRVVLTGGPCPPDVLTRHFGRLPGTRLFLEYAPDDGPLPWAAAEAKPGDGDWADPRGRLLPTANLRLRIADEDGRPLGPGLVGEVCADGMALPCDRIGHAPPPRFEDADGVATHRSGRQGRWRFDGTLEILDGRPG